MHCKPIKTTLWDRPCLVRWSAFLEALEPGDLESRDAQEVEDAYLASWFDVSDAGQVFDPPAFEVRRGKARFINGRHRAIVLSRHLEVLPMLFGQSPALLLDQGEPAANDTTVSAIVERWITEGDSIVLPDLRIVDAFEAVPDRDPRVEAVIQRFKASGRVMPSEALATLRRALKDEDDRDRLILGLDEEQQRSGRRGRPGMRTKTPAEIISEVEGRPLNELSAEQRKYAKRLGVEVHRGLSLEVRAAIVAAVEAAHAGGAPLSNAPAHGKRSAYEIAAEHLKREPEAVAAVWKRWQREARRAQRFVLPSRKR